MTPAYEKAAPIPAEGQAEFDVLWPALRGLMDRWEIVALAKKLAADRASQEENPRPAKTGGLETAVLRQPQEERIREKDDDTRLSLDVEWEERIREDERDRLTSLAFDQSISTHPYRNKHWAEGAKCWLRENGAMFPVQRTRQRGDAS